MSETDTKYSPENGEGLQPLSVIDLQNRLEAIAKIPQDLRTEEHKQEIMDLRVKKTKIIREAREAGVLDDFDNYINSLKPIIQRNIVFGFDKINKIDPNKLDMDAQNKLGREWKDEYRGVNSVCQHDFLDRINLAFLEAKMVIEGKSMEELNDDEREFVDNKMVLFGLDTDPEHIAFALDYIEKLEEKAKEQEQANRPLIELPQLPKEQQLATWLDAERWASYPYQVDQDKKLFLEMSEAERDLFWARTNLVRAVLTKRTSVFSAESLKGNPEANTLTGVKLQMLYNAPYVHEALIEWFRHLEDPDPVIAKGINSYRQCNLGAEKSMEELDKLRNYLVNRIVGNIESPTDEDKQAVFEAEQIAFNMMVIGNVFEARDSEWQELRNEDSKHPETIITRTRKFGIDVNSKTALMNKPIRTFFRPMDELLEVMDKDKNNRSPVGAFFNWAEYNLSRIDKKNYDFIGLLKDDNDQHSYWTIKKIIINGQEFKILIIPEFYPHKQFDSYFDRVSVETEGGRKKSLSKFLLNGERIPEGSFENFSDYVFPLTFIDPKWDALQVHGGKMGESVTGDWLSTINKVLAGLKQKNEPSVMRWLYYAKCGIHPDKILPYLGLSTSDKNSDKRIFRHASLGTDKGNKDPMFFPWDKPGMEAFGLRDVARKTNMR